jgi:hypothetical protein
MFSPKEFQTINLRMNLKKNGLLSTIALMTFNPKTQMKK